jgi:peptidoglycan/LPS O-acetylase OafA/YrhL
LSYDIQPPFFRDCSTGQELNFESRIILFITNIFIFGQDITIFFGSNNEGAIALQNGSLPSLYGCYLLPQGWSLGMELIFYLLAPFLVKQKNLILISIVVSGFLLKTILFSAYSFYEHIPSNYFHIYSFNLLNGLIQGAWTTRFLPAELTFFTIGILSFRFYQKVKTLLDLNIWSRLANFLLIAMLGVTVFYGTLCDTYPNFLKYTYFSLMFFAVPCLFHRTKANKADQFLGDLSYPIYINHVLILWVFVGVHSMVTTSASIVFAFFMKKYLIDPIDKIRMKRYNMLIRDQ